MNDSSILQHSFSYQLFLLSAAVLPFKFLFEIFLQILDLHSLLLHGISVADSHCAILLRLEIIGHAVGRSNLILTAVTLSDIAPLVKLTVVLFAELRINLFSSLAQLLERGSTPIFTGAIAGWK